jgi:hypothetical protein
MTRWTRSAVFLAAVFLTLPPAAADEPAPKAADAKLGLDEIVAGLEKSEKAWGSLKSWMVRYEHVREGINFALPIVDQSHEMVNARKGDWLYASETPVTAQKNSGWVWVSWRDGKYTQREGDSAFIQSKDDLLKSKGSSYLYQLWWYPANLGVYPVADAFPYKGDEKDKPRHVELAGYLKANKDRFRVRAKLENVDGTPCHVLEWPDREAIWIDPATGFSLRRRVVFTPLHAGRGTLAYEFKALRVRERTPGIWLPDRQVIVTFDGGIGEKGSRVEKVILSDLKEARFNDLPDDFFQVPLKDARQVFDLTKSKDGK